jgi:hypothetical protein
MTRARVLAPSDLAAGRARTAGIVRVRFGGRVAEATARRITLADALGSLVVHGPMLGCEPGDLVVVEGRLHRFGSVLRPCSNCDK